MSPTPPIKVLDVSLDEYCDKSSTSLENIKSCKLILERLKGRLTELFNDGVGVADLVSAHAREMDAILRHIWNMFVSADDTDIALIAVGGYGRAELHPGSDIDLMILLRNDDHSRYREELEQLVTFFWDTGMEIGHSVRSIDECVAEGLKDITVATNLMEARLIAGPPDLFDAMRSRTGPDTIWPSRDFFKAKWQEQTLRHHKFHDTSYNLEPNVKEGPGGLRDIQMIGWVAKRYFGAETLYELVKHEFLTEDEYQSLVEGQTTLWRVRYALHSLAGRREDRLLFDYQRTLAKDFGYCDDEDGLAVEKFMKQYYRTIMELNRLNEMLLQHFQEAILYGDESEQPVKLNNRFHSRKGFLEVRNEGIFKRYPFALLEMFLIIQQYPKIKGVRASTIRLVRSNLDLINDKFRADLRNQSIFTEILRHSSGVTHELRRMNRYGVLARYIPAFGKIVGLMQYDLFHAYTVDEHTLMVVRNLRRMSVKEFADELPFCSRLIEKIPKLEILYLAGLFHDIAKGRGGDHSVEGEKEALDFCIGHSMSDYDARFVAWLVRNHLIMSSTAQRKDISDPDVINEFASKVGDQTHLDYLYLLTIADIRATNATLWNSWKDALLNELYLSTKKALRRGLENPVHISDVTQEVQQRSHELLAQQVPSSEIQKLWHHLSEDYFLRHSAEEVAWHSQAIIENDGKTFPLILVQQEAQRGGTEIFIHTPVKNHLFATITRVLDQMGLTVVDARIIQSDAGYTFDTYVVLEESGEVISSQHRVEDILKALKNDIQNPDAAPKSINRRTARQLKHFDTPTQVVFNEGQGRKHTIMELITADRPGLLSQVGKALMECGVLLLNAKIATIGERVEDVFFITGPDLMPVTDVDLLEELRSKIIYYLDKQATNQST